MNGADANPPICDLSGLHKRYTAPPLAMTTNDGMTAFTRNLPALALALTQFFQSMLMRLTGQGNNRAFLAHDVEPEDDPVVFHDQYCSFPEFHCSTHNRREAFSSDPRTGDEYYVGPLNEDPSIQEGSSRRPVNPYQTVYNQDVFRGDFWTYDPFNPENSPGRKGDYNLNPQQREDFPFEVPEMNARRQFPRQSDWGFPRRSELQSRPSPNFNVRSNHERSAARQDSSYPDPYTSRSFNGNTCGCCSSSCSARTTRSPPEPRPRESNEDPVYIGPCYRTDCQGDIYYLDPAIERLFFPQSPHAGSRNDNVGGFPGSRFTSY